MCADCGLQTSVTAGTIFHRTRTPLATWFAAIWFITSQKNGVSALGLQRVLGFGSYETAWAWMHKLRRAMVRPDRDLLSGVVELDEVYIGNESRGRAGGVKDRCAAMVAVESAPGRKLGRVRMQIAGLAGSAGLVDFAQRVIKPGSHIKTDGALHLRRLSQLGYEHEYFTGLGSAEPAHVNLPGVHMIASLLKRWLTGTSTARAFSFLNGNSTDCRTPGPIAGRVLWDSGQSANQRSHAPCVSCRVVPEVVPCLRSPAHQRRHRRYAVAATSRTSQRSMAAPACGLDPGPKRSAIVRAFASVSQTVSESPLPAALPGNHTPDWKPGSWEIAGTICSRSPFRPSLGSTSRTLTSIRTAYMAPVSVLL